MKFRCERDVLAEALATAGRAVANRGGALPVLSGVRLELAGNRLDITGSDLDLTISVTVGVDGQEDGVVVLPSRLASDVVRSVGEAAVTVETDDELARITQDAAEFEIRLIPADEFPRLAEPAGDAVTIEAAAFAAALKQVIPAASADDSRPILTGVLLAAEDDGLRLVATDSYRLAVRTMAGSSVLAEGQRVLVPSRALAELARVLPDQGEVTLRLGERDAAFEDRRLRGVGHPPGHPPDRGGVPQLPGPHPVGPGQRAHRGAGRPARRPAPGQAVGPRGHARAPGHEARR